MVATQRSLFIVFCLVAPCLPCAAETKADDMTFDVVPASQQAALGSPITLTFRLRNDGKRDVLVNRRFLLNHVVQLEVTAPSGQKVEWCGPLVDVLVSRGDYAILKPAGRVERTMAVSCDGRGSPGYSFSTPGEYVVRARYEPAVPTDALDAIAKGAQLVRGPLAAAPIRVVVRGAK
jgi:hypothetical protein